MKICSRRIVRYLMFFFSIIIALTACTALMNIYSMDWYAVHFENGIAARFYTSITALLILCLLCFPWIRYIGIGVGLWGASSMTAKLWSQPFIKNIKMETTGQWPDDAEVMAIRILCILLILAALIWPFLASRMWALLKNSSVLGCISEKK